MTDSDAMGPIAKKKKSFQALSLALGKGHKYSISYEYSFYIFLA